jgi:enamine deaminase RidA (YjgF/YER057c/UK114 family)
MTIERWRGDAPGRNRTVKHGGTVYTVATAASAGPDIQSQTKKTLEIIEANLNEAGTDKTRMLSVQIFLVDMSEKEAMDAVWNAWIGSDWQSWPQRACVGAPLAGSTRIEVVVTAAAEA